MSFGRSGSLFLARKPKTEMAQHSERHWIRDKMIRILELTDVRDNQLRDFIMFGKNFIYSEHLCLLNTWANVPNIKSDLFRIYVPKLNCSEHTISRKIWFQDLESKFEIQDYGRLLNGSRSNYKIIIIYQFRICEKLQKSREKPESQTWTSRCGGVWQKGTSTPHQSWVNGVRFSNGH